MLIDMKIKPSLSMFATMEEYKRAELDWWKEYAKKLENELGNTCFLLTEFDLYSQDNNDYMGSPFRKRVLKVIESKG